MMANMSKLMMLKNALGQQQLQQQGLQTAKLENQQRQMDVDSTKAFQRAYMEAQGDPDKTAQLAAKYGAKPDALLSWKSAVNAQKIQAMDLVAKQGGEAKRQADLMQGAHDQIAALPAEQRQAAWPQALQQLSQQGVDISKSPANYPGDQAFQMLGFGIKSHAQQIEEALKAEETAKNKAQAGEADAATSLKNKELQWYNSNGGAPNVSPEVQGMAAYMTDPRLDAGVKKSPATFLAWKAKQAPLATFNLQNSGAAADAQGNPSSIAQAIASNRMKWSEAVSPRTPQATKNAIMAQVFKLNPSYDTSEFGLETDAAKKARSGAWADTRLAYNTAIDHSKQLLDTIDALGSGDVKRLNSLRNFFKTEFGSPDVPDYQAVANAYNHEVTTVVSKGHITDSEVKTGGSVLPDNASPQALKTVVQSYNKLMLSKRDELDKIIKGTAGSKANGVMGVQSGDQPTNNFFSNFGGKPR